MTTLSVQSDLRTFLDRAGDRVLWIDKPVPLRAVGALTAQANRTVVFRNIEGHTIPGEFAKTAARWLQSRRASGETN